MKKIISFFSAALILIGSITPIFAADTTAIAQKIHHFTIIAPPTTKVGEAIDIKVEARDKDDKVIPTYNGSVYFQSTSDFGATLPAQGKSVQFKESDKGVITLSKAIIFKRAGSQNLTVTETIEDADGVVTIKVDPASDTSTGWAESITIITPDNNSSITSDTVTVSGKTKKNSKVSLKLNGKDVATVISDDAGLYTKTIADITQDSNILTASVLDGNNAVVGTTESKFSTANGGPKILATSITPGTSVESGSPITILTEGDSGLAEVSFNLDGSVIKATEKTPGKYSADTVAPAKSGAYVIAVTGKNNTGKTTTQEKAATLTVTEKAVADANFKNVQIMTEGTKVKFQFSVENPPKELAKFKIGYGESAESLSSETMTYEATKIIGTGGVYNWYIDKLAPKTYSFKIFGVKADGSLIEGLVSEALSATIGKPGCTIGNVGDISVTTTQDKSILSWASVSGALSYNLYKVTPAGDYELIQNLKDTKYTVLIASGAVTYENFAIKALCDGTTESATPSLASKVQTGPGALAILVILSGLVSLFFFRRKFI